jgi:UDP-glucose 4-epimerase
MATVIGIFEDHYLKKKPLPVVRPGTQSRRFTHIDDTINTVFLHGKITNVDFIVFLIKKVFLF